MAIFNIKDLTFKYYGAHSNALNNLNLCIEEGGFYVICGKSGSGKSTFLRLLKKELAPNGDVTGSIEYCGQSLESLSGKVSASEIGFVCQDVDSQLVCDKVWKELSFGLGNLGYSDEYIASRIGEVSEYFGISKWYNKKVSELSGGSKQIVAIASVMTTNPKVLLLDEPTSMLDPIAKKNLVALLERLNKELGVTIVVVEHNMESVFDVANKVIVLDNGVVVAEQKPCDLPQSLVGKNFAKYIGMTEFAELLIRLNCTNKIPQTFAEKKEWIKSKINIAQQNECTQEPKNFVQTDVVDKKQIVLEAKDIWFRYEKKGLDIVSGANFALKQGEIVCIVGGNGGGKTTFANILTGVLKPYSGKVKKDKNSRIALLPQNAKGLFVEDSVQNEMYVLAKLLKEDKLLADQLIAKFELEYIKNIHPYDISGGEVQRLALAKLFLTKPDIIILDEPTQGMDMAAKEYLKNFLKVQTNEGKSVIVITHDLRFAAEVADKVGLFFDGKILSMSNVESFFDNNMLYTTESSLLTREFAKGLCNVDKVAKWLEPSLK